MIARRRCGGMVSVTAPTSRGRLTAAAGGGPVQSPAAAAGPAGAVRPAAPGPVVAAGAGPGRVGLGPPRRAAGPGEPGGQGVEEVVVDAAGHDRGDGGVAVIARPGRRAAGPPAGPGAAVLAGAVEQVVQAQVQL